MTQSIDEFRARTKSFALRVIRLVQALPKNSVADVLGRQLLRAGTSVGANYRASCRAKSSRDFVAKMAIVEEEADECIYWMELMIDAKLIKASLLTNLIQEANELLSMVVASIRTARKRM